MLMSTFSKKNLIVFYLATKGMESGDLSAILHFRVLSMLIVKLPRKSAEMLEWLEKKNLWPRNPTFHTIPVQGIESQVL